jgi:ADP-dependent NAD(P)H-hydrate dehydratase / NAD(P)H-hydrate epimerase
MKQLESFLAGFNSHYTIFDNSTAFSLYKPRDPFANKGDFGHALILAGSYGKIGAAILAAKACLLAGAGLVSAHLPSCGYEIMQTALPEVMVSIGEGEFELTGFPLHTELFQAAGVGPGIGTNDETAGMLKKFLKSFHQPLVLDADALNIISKHSELLSSLHPDTIITPHVKEFDRLFGISTHELLRFEKAKEMAIRYKIIVVLKGHFTGVFFPNGNISFNTSGNAGMAKGGSGDALTGIVTALLAQSYSPGSAATLGTFIHGYAGDLAASSFSEESMTPTDLINCLGKAFLVLKKK